MLSSDRRDGRIADLREHLSNLNYVALVREYFDQGSRDGRRHLRINLVSRDLKEDLIKTDLITDLFEPAGDCSLGNCFAQLGHSHVSHQVPFPRSVSSVGSAAAAPLSHQPCSDLPVSDNTVSPKSSLMVG